MADTTATTEKAGVLEQAPETLQDNYRTRGEEFRKLGIKQFEIGLTPEELQLRKRLEVMAGFGLFETGLSNDQLKVRQAAYEAKVSAQAEEVTDPGVLAAEYRRLGQKLVNDGLKADELARYNHLDELAGQGMFELPNYSATPVKS